MSLYEYQAAVFNVVDGDTVDAHVDLGFRINFDMRLRLYGINAPEMHTPEGPPAKAHLEGLLGNLPASLTIHTAKDKQEKYGRWLATLIRADGVDCNASMVADGFAVVYLP